MKDGLISVAVVGAGPAGCAAAIALRARDIDVTVFEAGHPWKDKACGDGLISRAVHRLNLIGLDNQELMHLGARQFDTIALKDRGSENPWRFDHQGGLMIRRRVLDQALRERVAMTASVRYAARVRRIQHSVTGWGLYLDLPGKVDRFGAIVIAAGASRGLPAQWELDGRPLAAISMTGYAEIPTPAEPSIEFFGSSTPGYRWVFPSSDGGANVGVCTLKNRNLRRLRPLMAELLEDIGSPPVSAWRGGLGTLWSGQGSQWHDERGLLSCGDAAGLVDPVTGEGMTAALISGTRAGIAAADFVTAAGSTNSLKTYSEWIYAHFSERYAAMPLRTFFAEKAKLVEEGCADLT